MPLTYLYVYHDPYPNDDDISFIGSCSSKCVKNEYMRCTRCHSFICRQHFNKQLRTKHKLTSIHQSVAQTYICHTCSQTSPNKAYSSQTKARLELLNDCEDEDALNDITWILTNMIDVEIDKEKQQLILDGMFFYFFPINFIFKLQFEYKGKHYDLAAFTPRIVNKMSKNGSLICEHYYNPLYSKLMNWPSKQALFYGSCTETKNRFS